MLKAKAGNNLVFGLTDENIQRLKKGQPIKFNLKELGLADQTVLIIYGKDEQAFRDLFKDLIDPLKTHVKDYKSKDN